MIKIILLLHLRTQIKAKKKRHDSDASGSTPLPYKDSKQSIKKKQDSNASAAQKPPAQTSSAWKITNTKDASSGSLIHMLESQSKQSFDDSPILDVKHNSDPEDIDTAHLPKTGDMGSFIKWFCKRTGKKMLCKADLEDKVDLVNPEGHQILPNVYKPLPLGGPPGQLTIQPQFFFNKDLDYLLSGDKEQMTALSTSKLKAAYYLDFRLEELVLSLWAKSELRSHMQILSVISLKSYERYGYNYLREIVIRRADYKGYKISEADFKSMHPNDFKDMYLLHLQRKLNHLSKSDKIHLHTAINLWIRNLVIRIYVEDLHLGIESYQTKLNLELPNWDASDFLFKEDYTIVNKPRIVIYKDKNDQKKMIRISKVHKFSEGTLTRIWEKLDFMVKDYMLFQYNPGIEKRIWTEDDRRRSQDFIEAIERRLKIRRIFRSLESFVGGQLRDIDYRLINKTT
ncbi:hypothetical protein Tco_0816549 [Tanacetum coccineum]